MKTIKSLSILALFIISSFVLTSSKCSGSDCAGPSVIMSPSATSITAAPGESFSVTIAVTGTDNKIKSVEITKSSNGVTGAFFSNTSVSSNGFNYTLTDTIPAGVSIGSVYTYTITAKSDCKDETATQLKLTVTVGASATVIIDSVGNSTSPRVYSRYSISASNNSAWDLLNKLPKFAADANSDKDIRDSIVAANPFTGNTRWGSRNGSKFVKAPGFDWANCSPKTIVAAYNAGTASDLISFVKGDIIIVNIKNSGKYAAVKIKDVVDDGAVNNEDYTFFSYKLAQ